MQAYINGKIYSDRGVFHEAMLVKENRIHAIGTNREIMKQTNVKTEAIDLKGYTVVPGFNDSHLHFLMTAEYLAMLPIADVTSMEQLIERGRQYILDKQLMKEDYLYTEGWNQNQFTDGKRIPTRHDLDRISSEIPIAMGRVDRHIFSLNTPALKQLGITKDTPSPEGGEIRKDKNGEPTGVLTERAIDILRANQPQPNKEEQKEMLKRTMQLANSQGLTSVHTCDCKDNRISETYSLYEEMDKEGELTVRFYQQMWFNDGKYLPAYI